MKTVNNFSYETPIKFDLVVLESETLQYQNDATATKTSKNNALSLSKKLHSLAQENIFCQGTSRYFSHTMVGSSKGNTARVYYNPSYTQYPRIVRKAIVPMNPENKFVYFDVKSAEYILNCIFADDKKTLELYFKGEDPYLAYAEAFPEGTTRDQMKTALIANMYGMSAYTLGKRLGVSETAAKRILRSINSTKTQQSELNTTILFKSQRDMAYYCPNGLDNLDLLKVADVDSEVGYSENRALSVYTQSALAVWIQGFITKLLDIVEPGTTLISVFDSILFEVPKTADEDLIRIQLSEMVAPFRIDVGFGSNFYEAQTSAK